MRKTLDRYLDEQLGRGRGYLTKAEAMKTVGLSATAFAAAAARLARQRRLASPKHGFYLILRPEDRAAGGPDPARWIDPLMHHLGLNYRISLLRAAAFHGASHQAAQVFQVIVPKQLRTIAIDRERIQFVYQVRRVFAEVNKAPWLDQLKTDAGFANVAGVELLLLDAVRYFRQAAGLNGAAQIVHDLGANADPRKLARAATAYENSTARRLGYLLERFGHARQAASLRPLARKAKSLKPLDPSLRMVASLARNAKVPEAPAWKLSLNVPLEIDA
jgi:transcriptional regulator with AbiEi antitoxin domain of type IV toxin-antitoxin system